MAELTKAYTVSTERTFKYCVDNIWTDTFDCDDREEIDVYCHLLTAVKGMLNGYSGYESEGFFKTCFYDIILRKPDLCSVFEAEKYVDDMDKALLELMVLVFPMPWCYVPTASETVAMGMNPNPVKKTLCNLYVSTIKDYISLLDDNEKTRLCRNLRVDFESGQKPKKDPTRGPLVGKPSTQSPTTLKGPLGEGPLVGKQITKPPTRGPLVGKRIRQPPTTLKGPLGEGPLVGKQSKSVLVAKSYL